MKTILALSIEVLSISQPEHLGIQYQPCRFNSAMGPHSNIVHTVSQGIPLESWDLRFRIDS